MLYCQQKVDGEGYVFNKYRVYPDKFSQIDKILGTNGKFIVLSTDNHDINDI
jgi:hypothetical protein